MGRYLYRLKWFLFRYTKRCLRKFFGIRIKMKKYNGSDILSAEEANDILYDVIAESPKDGYFAGRFGVNELNAFVKFDHDIGSLSNARDILKKIGKGAGFFPETVSAGERFSIEMREACKDLDMLAVWHISMEDYVVKKYSDNPAYCRPKGLEPYYFENPWSQALKGKRVLVIHPFAESIEKQYYSNREKLFKDENVLPEFELKTLEAVQTIAGCRDERFGDWFEALDYMTIEALKVDFDVAIIGCGAYGFPLAARLKRKGKIAIHLGGATQMMFGVKGSRWEKMPEFKDIINSYWVRPNEKERPYGAEKVENACYW